MHVIVYVVLSVVSICTLQASSGAVKSEKRPQRRPPAELYRPPVQKGEGLYCIEIEVIPGRWHQEVIEEVGELSLKNPKLTMTNRLICRLVYRYTYIHTFYVYTFIPYLSPSLKLLTLYLFTPISDCHLPE